jgi:hypothetical protein
MQEKEKTLLKFTNKIILIMKVTVKKEVRLVCLIQKKKI